MNIKENYKNTEHKQREEKNGWKYFVCDIYEAYFFPKYNVKNEMPSGDM